MAAKRVGIMDIRQLLQLKIKGKSNRRVEEIIGIHRNSVNTYVRLFKASGKSYRDLLELSDKDLSELFPSSGTIDKQRYEDLSSDFDYFRKELKKPGCTRQKLWKEYLFKCPEGYGYTQFNEHLNRWLHRVKGSGKLEHKAGDKLLVDYTGQKPSYVNKETGELIEVEVIVAILPCSQYTFVEASPSQKLEDFIGSMNSCLDYLGGVPQVIVPDNLKSAVTKGSKYAPILNKTFKDFALHMVAPSIPHGPIRHKIKRW
jgi:transposase